MKSWMPLVLFLALLLPACRSSRPFVTFTGEGMDITYPEEMRLSWGDVPEGSSLGIRNEGPGMASLTVLPLVRPGDPKRPDPVAGPLPEGAEQEVDMTASSGLVLRHPSFGNGRVRVRADRKLVKKIRVTMSL